MLGVALVAAMGCAQGVVPVHRSHHAATGTDPNENEDDNGVGNGGDAPPLPSATATTSRDLPDGRRP